MKLDKTKLKFLLIFITILGFNTFKYYDSHNPIKVIITSTLLYPFYILLFFLVILNIASVFALLIALFSRLKIEDFEDLIYTSMKPVFIISIVFEIAMYLIFEIDFVALMFRLYVIL